jgi:hypothetical protein
MAAQGSSRTTETVQKLKREIDRLTVIQAKALKTATFGGMTPEEAKEYDNRREEILKLVERLAMLEKSQ